MWIDDQILVRAREDLVVHCFVPDANSVVLGCSNKPQLEVDQEFCQKAGIPVLRRYGGGGTVVLYPGCVVISVGVWVRDQYENAWYFRSLNQSVIDLLRELYPEHAEGFGQKGISDITYDERKIAGTSLFRSKNYLLYQASLLVDCDFELISGCLTHPSREPEYRGGRPHKEFLFGLSSLASHGVQEVCIRIGQKLPNQIRDRLNPRLIASQPGHIKHLMKRARLSG